MQGLAVVLCWSVMQVECKPIVGLVPIGPVFVRPAIQEIHHHHIVKVDNNRKHNEGTAHEKPEELPQRTDHKHEMQFSTVYSTIHHFPIFI